ncbi:MAG: hypothetical protein J6Y28_01635 [Acholeplasmatales bacterium]|nr:hypothetical protein [Methanobrevibacter sp.]MBP5444849.1 hypothetical protein [Acholeplasmatales bacterium]
MEYNKSLSARIKRRNKAGFKGVGNHSKNPKLVTVSINDDFINYKYEDKQINSYQRSLINFAKKHGYSKHAGSKFLGQLRHYL